MKEGLKGNSHSILKVLFRHESGETAITTDNLCQDTRFSGRDSNQAPLEYKSRTLPSTACAWTTRKGQEKLKCRDEERERDMGRR